MSSTTTRTAASRGWRLQDNKAINTTLGALPLNLVERDGESLDRRVQRRGGANVVTTCFNMPPWYNDKEIPPPRSRSSPTLVQVTRGDWNHVEVYAQLNSVSAGIGQADGVLQYWFNGTLVIDRHDMLFRTGARPNIQFRQFLIAPYIGDGSPVDQYAWFDDLTVASGQIAGVPSPSVSLVTINPAVVSVVVVRHDPAGGDGQ